MHSLQMFVGQYCSAFPTDTLLFLTQCTPSSWNTMASRFGSLIILFLVLYNNPKIITASLDIKSGDCVPEKDFMRIVEWFFRQSEVLVVIDLDQNDILGGFQKHFLEKVFSGMKFTISLNCHLTT